MTDQSLDLNQNSRFDSALLHVCVLLFIAMVALATIQITVRQINPVLAEFNVPTNSLPWTEPTARFSLIILTYVGAAVAARNGEHIAISILPDRVEQRWPLLRQGMDLVVFSLCALFMLIVFRGAASASISEWETNLGGVGFMTSGMIYLTMSIGVGIAAYYYGIEIANTLKQINEMARGKGK